MSSRSFTPLMLLYLFFALLGLIVPWYFNLQHMLYSPIPISVGEYIRQGTATPLAASLTYDFLIASFPAVIWMIVEARRLKIKPFWPFIVCTFLIAFAFAFPLFLFFRERKVQAINQD